MTNLTNSAKTERLCQRSWESPRRSCSSRLRNRRRHRHRLSRSRLLLSFSLRRPLPLRKSLFLRQERRHPHRRERARPAVSRVTLPPSRSSRRVGSQHDDSIRSRGEREFRIQRVRPRLMKKSRSAAARGFWLECSPRGRRARGKKPRGGASGPGACNSFFCQCNQV